MNYYNVLLCWASLRYVRGGCAVWQNKPLTGGVWHPISYLWAYFPEALLHYYCTTLILLYQEKKAAALGGLVVGERSVEVLDSSQPSPRCPFRCIHSGSDPPWGSGLAARAVLRHTY